MEELEPRDVFKRFGVLRGLQVMGFCALWRIIGKPELDVLTADVRAKFGEEGLKKSAVYNYVNQLKDWNSDLGGDPQRVEGLVLILAKMPDEEPEHPTGMEVVV